MASAFPRYRLDKLGEIRALGPGPDGEGGIYRDRVRDAVSSVRAARAMEGLEEPLALVGRVLARRKAGKLTFLDLQDYSDRIQVIATLDALGEERYKLVRLIDLGDIIGVRGTIGRSRTGELSIFAGELILCAKALRDPPEKFHGMRDPELRARHRYIDLFSNREVATVFEQRAIVVREMRRYLEDRDFLEVETPMLHPIAGGAAARPFVTHHNTLHMDLFLRIAPELYLKRLLVGGFTRVFEINRNFRNEGISPTHNPEFTMLEAYQVNGDMWSMMDLTEGMIRAAAQALEDHHARLPEGHGERAPFDPWRPTWRGRTLDLRKPFARRSLAELVREHVGVDPADAAALRRRAAAAGIEGAGDLSHGALLGLVFETLVEEHLDGPVFVHGYPRAMSPLALESRQDPEICERFELFAAGVELANAFSELNDPAEQRRRFEAAVEGDGDREVDEDFLFALEHGMPPAGGLGVGVDRVVQLLLGCDTIRDVILFPTVRPKDAGRESEEG